MASGVTRNNGQLSVNSSSYATGVMSEVSPSPNRNTEFVENTSKGVIRGEVRFGAEVWKKYFGDVGAEPPLPANVTQIDNATCPFSNDHTVKVKDTHMWVLIPAKVNGVSLTLNTLQKLIQNPLGDAPETDYVDYNDDVKKELGDVINETSYWALMTRDVIPGSRSKRYDDQKVLVAGYPGYTLPRALVAAVCLSVEYVTSGTRLYNQEPDTFSRCEDKVGNYLVPVEVGAFGPAGFFVIEPFVAFGAEVDSGVAAIRKF